MSRIFANLRLYNIQAVSRLQLIRSYACFVPINICIWYCILRDAGRDAKFAGHPKDFPQFL